VDGQRRRRPDEVLASCSFFGFLLKGQRPPTIALDVVVVPFGASSAAVGRPFKGKKEGNTVAEAAGH
jgi:hypothetical protein